MKKIALIFLCMIMSISVVACGTKTDEFSDKTKVKISFFKAGFGDEWIKAIASEYEKLNPEIKIIIEGDESMDDLVKTRFESGRKDKISDIVSVTNMVYYSNFVRNGYLENLNSLYTTEIENGETLNDVIEENFFEFAKVQDDYYGVAWEGAVTGFAYNKKMFEINGWQVPSTMDEFFRLCATIKAKNIAPVVYCGGIAEGYFQNLFLSWFAQYEGVESTEEFFGMENAEVFKKVGRLKAYEQIAKIVADKEVKLAGSNGMDHLAAQRAFIKGEAAMLPSGSWLETEMGAFLKGYPNFEMAMFPVPSILADSEGLPVDKSGNQALTVSTGNGDLLCIPKDAPNKEIAKDFLLFMSRQDMLKLYVEKTGGNPRPFKIKNTDWSGLSAFGQSVVGIWQNSYNIFPYSSSSEFLRGDIGFNMAQAGQFCSYLQNSPSVQDATRLRAQSLYDDDYGLAKNKLNK